MKICAIDIGTNSVLYLLAKINSSSRLTPLVFKAKTTRLGEYVHKKGFLSQKAQQRTIAVVKQFIKDASRRKAHRYILAGTSALREAKNSIGFIRQLYKETGKTIRILSESEEARLVFSATKNSLNPAPRSHSRGIGVHLRTSIIPPSAEADGSPWCGVNIKSGNALIFDIGGGSTELIFAKCGKLAGIKSIPVGAVNLTERFGDNIDKMQKFTENKIKPHARWKQPLALIGVGGTVTTLCAILKGLKKYDTKKIHGNRITYPCLFGTIEKLSKISLSQRKKLIPFDPKRADIILAGLVILKVIINLFNKDGFTVCDKGLVYGLAIQTATK